MFVAPYASVQRVQE